MEAGITWYVRKVLARLNENEAELEAAVVYGDMGMELRRLAAELLPSAARKVFMESPHEWIDEVKVLSGITHREESGVLELEMTPDFLRLVELRMSDWATSIYTWSEPERQYLPDAGSGGEWLAHHPETVISDGSDNLSAAYAPAAMPAAKGGGRVIRIWGTTAGSRPVTMAYLPEPEVVNDRLWVPKGLSEAVINECAAMIKIVVGD